MLATFIAALFAVEDTNAPGILLVVVLVLAAIALLIWILRGR